MNRIFWLSSLSIVLLGGCVPRSVTVRATADLLGHGISAVYEERDPQFARDAMPAQLKLMEVLLKNDPTNSELLRSLAEGYTGYAFLFLEDEHPDRAAEFYDRSAGFALRLLDKSGSLAGLTYLPKERTLTTLAGAKLKDAPALYWLASAWASRANLRKNDTEALTRIPLAVRMMERVLELDPSFQHAGPDLFFGVYYSGRPRLAGGDPERGARHFEAALTRTDRRFLFAQLLYAKYHCVAVLDEDLFKSLTTEISSRPVDILPEAALLNAVARMKSKRLSENFDDLF